MKTKRSSTMPVIRSADDIFTAFDKINELIRERAYYIYHNRDNGEGDEISDWFNAESELRTRTDFSVEEKEDQVIVQGEIKHFKPEEIEIKINDNLFNIGGIHSEQSRTKKRGTSTETAKQICFYQQFNLPADVDTERMDVEMKNGKLTATLPKTKH